MIKGEVRWMVQGDPVFLKGSGAQVNAPERCWADFRETAESGIPNAIRSGMVDLAQQMEAYAKANHPWTNQTGNAERTLKGQVVADLGSGAFAAGLSHGVPYGRWLEVRWNGRYGIVLRTMEVFRERAKGIVAGAIELDLRGKGSKFRGAGGRWT